MTNKKAMAIEALVALILIAAVTLFILIYYLNAKNKYDEYSDREVCRESVIAQSISLWADKTGGLVGLSCPTYNVQFFNNHVEKNGRTLTVTDPVTKEKVRKFSQLDDKVVNQVLSEELRWCWYQFAEGKRSIFDMATFFGNVLGEDKRLCYVCDEVMFDQDVKQDKFVGFYNYTKNTTMPNSDLTYYQYYAEAPRLSAHTEQIKKLKWDFDESVSLGLSYGLPEEEFNKLVFSNSWESYFNFYVRYKLFDLKYFISSQDVELSKDKLYTVLFIRRGYTSQAKGVGLGAAGLAASQESYFAYVLPQEAIPQVCSVFKRGGEE